MATKRAASSELEYAEHQRKKQRVLQEQDEKPQELLQEILQREVNPGNPDNHYRLVSKLGQGGFGSVYRGQTIRGSKDVAIKVVQMNPDCISPLLAHELLILKSHRHRNMVAYIDSFLADSSLWLMMEFIDGLAVSELVKYYRLRDYIMSKICKGILKALEYLHSCDVIHRDIKGQNIILGLNGDVKLADFGLSMVEGASMKRGAGTPSFMAPEVFTTNTYTKSIDIWSLGMTVIQMVNGKQPYGHIKSKAEKMRLITSYVKPEIKGEESLPSTTHRFIKSCLKIEPTERATASELLEQPFICIAASTEQLSTVIRQKKRRIEEKVARLLSLH